MRSPTLVIFAISICCAVAVAQKLPTKAEITKSHDRFEDKSSVTLNMPLNENSNRMLVLMLDAQYSGTPKPPDHLIAIMQWLSGKGYAPWGESCTLNVIADATRLKLVFTNPPDGIQRTRDGLMYVSTVAMARMAYQDFRIIARAKQVEMRFEGEEFALSQAQLAKFREYLTYLGDK